ncbi:unnamed protein product, partial [Prunus brigantina]
SAATGLDFDCGDFGVISVRSSGGLCIPEWDRALTGFARTHNPGATRIRCPCRRCNNTLWETYENVEFHLVRNGMIETYNIWNLHGEQLDNASSSNATRVENVEHTVDPNEEVMDIINDVFPFASADINQEGEDDLPTPIDSAEFEQYEQLLKNANQELYPSCKNFSVLTAIVELMHGKIKYRMSNVCFDYFLGVFKRMLPTDNCLPNDHRHAQKVLNGLGLDGEAWKAFDRTFPEFAAEPRNVRLGLATDGFNPSIDVYLRPLVDELKDLWTNGVRTYDKSTGKMFTLRASVMWTVNDFPAYAMVSGWSTKGYMACPVCKEDVTSGWHAGKVCYLGHRRWLSWDHEWREKDKQFDGNTERRLRPREWSDDEILDQLNRLDFAPFGKTVSRTRPSTHLNWTHKSMFFELPYWSKLKLRHNLDVMHVEKNVFDTLIGTILDIEGKTKDTIKARLDLERMGIRRGLWMNRDSDKARRDLAFFSMKPNDKKDFLKFISS